MRPEHGVENYACTIFRRAGWYAHKMSQGGGIADRLMISPKAFHLYVEFKRPGRDKLDPRQRAWSLEMQMRIMAGLRGRHIMIAGPIDTREHARSLLELVKTY